MFTRESFNEFVEELKEIATYDGVEKAKYEYVEGILDWACELILPLTREQKTDEEYVYDVLSEIRRILPNGKLDVQFECYANGLELTVYTIFSDGRYAQLSF